MALVNVFLAGLETAVVGVAVELGKSAGKSRRGSDPVLEPLLQDTPEIKTLLYILRTPNMLSY